jgi:hypothetical protein
MHRKLGLAFFALLSAQCSNSIEVVSDGGTQPITASDAPKELDSRFALGLVTESSLLCSAVLIAPNVVLTARHCVDPISTVTAGDCTKTFFTGVSADDSFAVTPCPNVKEHGANGCAWFRSAKVIRDRGDYLCGNDLAFVILQNSIPTDLAVPTPAELDRERFQRQVQSPLVAIGFGRDRGELGWGQRHVVEGVNLVCDGADDMRACSAQVSNAGLTASEFVTSGFVCTGDSGGPIISMGPNPRVLGVFSRAEVYETGCGRGIYNNTHHVRELIRAAVWEGAAQGGYAYPEWTLRPSGDVCRGNGECLSGKCSSLPLGRCIE